MICEEEFGRQPRTSWIEEHMGLPFGSLAGCDPFREQEGREPELVSPDQLQFL